MRILFVHDRFPGQFRHLAQRLAEDPANEVRFMTRERTATLPGVEPIFYCPMRAPHAATHHYVRPLEAAVLNGQAAYRACVALKRQGFKPDVIYSHAGFGPGLYLRDAFPDARLVGYFEWYYRGRGGDAEFLASDGLEDDALCRLRTRNAGLLLELSAADQGVCPTEFQRRQFPAEFRGKLEALHDGIDTGFFAPGPGAVPGLDRLDGAEIVTYATRGMEPYRGFPQFMRAAHLILGRRPRARIVIAGTDAVAYSRRPSTEDGSYREQMLRTLPDLDLARVHFVGHLPPDAYRNLLRASAAHVYLTVPFVLSWSLLEAMATGCAVVASDTDPVREVISDGTNGLLTDFFDVEAIADRVTEVLDEAPLRATLGQAARRTIVGRYDLQCLLPQQLRLLTGQMKVDRAAA